MIVSLLVSRQTPGLHYILVDLNKTTKGMAKMGDFHLALVVGDTCRITRNTLCSSGKEVADMNSVVVIQTILYGLKADNGVIKEVTHSRSSDS